MHFTIEPSDWHTELLRRRRHRTLLLFPWNQLGRESIPLPSPPPLLGKNERKENVDKNCSNFLQNLCPKKRDGVNLFFCLQQRIKCRKKMGKHWGYKVAVKRKYLSFFRAITLCIFHYNIPRKQLRSKIARKVSD